MQSAQADSERIKLLGSAEAGAISSVGKADAERMRQKAAVYKQYGDAAILSLVLESLPKVSYRRVCQKTWRKRRCVSDCGRSGGATRQNRRDRPDRRSRFDDGRHCPISRPNTASRQCLNRSQPVQSAREITGRHDTAYRDPRQIIHEIRAAIWNSIKRNVQDNINVRVSGAVEIELDYLCKRLLNHLFQIAFLFLYWV